MRVLLQRRAASRWHLGLIYPRPVLPLSGSPRIRIPSFTVPNPPFATPNLPFTNQQKLHYYNFKVWWMSYYSIKGGRMGKWRMSLLLLWWEEIKCICYSSSSICTSRETRDFSQERPLSSVFYCTIVVVRFISSRHVTSRKDDHRRDVVTAVMQGDENFDGVVSDGRVMFLFHQAEAKGDVRSVF